jgi:hypothetical protein
MYSVALCLMCGEQWQQLFCSRPGKVHTINTTNGARLRLRLSHASESGHGQKIQINHQQDATIFQFIILTFVYSSTCFGRSPAHHQELNECSSSLWFYLRIVVIAVLLLVVWPAGPTTNNNTATTMLQR